MSDKVLLTQAILESLRTQSGGFNRDTLMLIGVGWPPYKKWKKKLVGTEIDSELLSLALRSSENIVSEEILYKSAKALSPPSYPQQESKFEIQSFIYSSLKDHFDIRGEVYLGYNTLDLVIFSDDKAVMIINVLREGEEVVYHGRLPIRIIRNMVDAEKLISVFMKKSLGLI
jgi:hypothetical protein